MLSQSAGYAISALGIIAMANGKPVLIKDIAKHGGIPPDYLGKLVHTLARKRIVSTKRGIGGGVVLLAPAETLTLHDICEIFDEPAIGKRCLLAVADCANDRACPCHHFWRSHRSKLIEFLKKTTITHMASFEIRETLRKNTPQEPSLKKRKKSVTSRINERS
jgi:Rrf2 family protein